MAELQTNVSEGRAASIFRVEGSVVVFWVVILCSNAVGYQASEGRNISTFTLKMQATWSPKLGILQHHYKVSLPEDQGIKGMAERCVVM
jgi:hypothetical protein